MVLKGVLNLEEREEIYKNWQLSLDKKNDHQAIGTFTIRQADFLRPVHAKLKDILQKETGLFLREKFTIIREYRKGDKLEKHVDNAAPFAITIVVKQSDNKENLLVFYNENTDIVNLQEGDGYYFKGMEVPHERKEVQSDYLLHIYLGYSYLHTL